jgi:hypothetical protein
VNAPNSSDLCSAPAPACLAAWDSHVVVIINPDSPSSLRDHLVALAVLYALAFQDARMWDRAAVLYPRSLLAFADGLRSGFAGSRLGDQAAPPAGWDAGRSGQEGRPSLPLALPPPSSSVVPTARLCLWAPVLAQSLHAALSAGDLSTRKAASVLEVDLSTLHAWLEGHGIVPDFDL